MAVLDPVLDTMSRYLGQELNHRVGAARKLNAEYFKRIDALDFAMYHDDGQQAVELRESRRHPRRRQPHIENADQRLSRAPRREGGQRADGAGCAAAAGIVRRSSDRWWSASLISADRLIHIRRNRLVAMKETRAGDYTDEDAVRREVMDAQKLFEREGWPTIDVSRRSIEETAAAVLNLLAEHRGEHRTREPGARFRKRRAPAHARSGGSRVRCRCAARG